jgi:hypothetical protein
MMFFTSGTPNMSGYLHVDFRVLRELLRLPRDVNIVAVRPDPNDSRKCIVDVGGALPFDGELEATYRYEDTTIVTFAGFKQVVRDEEA